MQDYIRKKKLPSKLRWKLFSFSLSHNLMSSVWMCHCQIHPLAWGTAVLTCRHGLPVWAYNAGGLSCSVLLVAQRGKRTCFLDGDNIPVGGERTGTGCGPALLSGRRRARSSSATRRVLAQGEGHVSVTYKLCKNYGERQRARIPATKLWKPGEDALLMSDLWSASAS